MDLLIQTAQINILPTSQATGVKLKLINKNSQKLKILGTGDIKDKVSIEADLISKAAVVKLEKAGGTIQLKK